MDRRFRSGHPWIYSNELSQSPKGIEPGQMVELHDPGGVFLALGYGNPKSLIAFRVVDRSPEARSIEDLFSAKYLTEKLLEAHSLRHRAGLTKWSYRLCYGEGDSLPGLIVDRYRTEKGQVFVVQAHTAGADRMLKALPEVLEVINEKIQSLDENAVKWSETAIVYNNDLGIRVLEGIEAEKPKVIRPLSDDSLSPTKILVRSVSGSEKPVEFSVDLIQGQKTGFFLDQATNVGIAVEKFAQSPQWSPEFAQSGGKPVRILDLCCYVGQWGTQLARAFRERGIKVEITAVDASQTALDFARENMEREGAKVTALKGDALKDLTSLAPGGFDIVVCDPPALIKGRKDIPQGKHAYLQINTQVFRLVRKGGAVVSCSCSALFEEEEFTSTSSG
jgi:23S rRNA (cytosine1962-C5)-methyltransferase